MTRSLKKGAFVDDSVMKKIDVMNQSGTKKVIKTWSRRSTITPEWSGIRSPFTTARSSSPST